MKKSIVIAGILIILGSAGILFFFYTSNIADAPITDEEEVASADAPVFVTERPHIIRDMSDQDNDGIPDDLEKEQGLSTNRSDTDGDGIPDKDELERWGTDPTKKDTDDDGFSDMTEIANGYNPSGEGTLQQ